jgi:8-oxo-dGTP pyrophosphatase MutT (NUDIX family)
MYKVFIDNWPIHFVYKSTILTSVEKSSMVVFNDSLELHHLLSKHEEFRQKSKILIVLINNFDEIINKIFVEYKKINAAGGVVLNQHNQILIIERLGCWDLPKGKVEKDEDIRKAAIREVEEECGISNPAITSELITTYHTYFMKNKNYFKTTYWYEMRYMGETTLIPQSEESITKAEWRSQDNLKDVFENTYLSIAEVLKTFLNEG